MTKKILTPQEKAKKILSDNAYLVLLEMKKLQVATVATVRKNLEIVNPSHFKKLENEGFTISNQTVLKCAECGSSRKVLEHSITEKGMNYIQ
jgi:hypothetical protein